MIIAVLSLTLLIFAGFVADFGQAYVYRRHLQTGADSASLAATEYYMDHMVGDCSAANIATWKTGAEAQGDSYMKQNVPNAAVSGTNIESVVCNGRGVEVTYKVLGSTPTAFGQLAGAGKKITSKGRSAAAYDVSGNGMSGNLRPWGMCSNALNQTLKVTQVSFANQANAGCMAIGASGTWNRYACPGDAKYNANETEDRIANGCTSATIPVPTATSTNPTTLSQQLISYCAGQSKNSNSTASCLTRDTGNTKNNDNKVLTPWYGLVGKTFQVPVFCGYPQCTPDAMGSNDVFPVYAVATVELCGFWMKSNRSDVNGGKAWPADCAGTNNPSNWNTNSARPNNNDAFYYIIKAYVTATDSFGALSQDNLRLTK